jgi:S-DNA-T family DNA segregation ATPase FtsK/SpoIIIE
MTAKARDTRLQEFLGVLLLALGLFLLISLLSYDPQDPSLISVSSLPAVHNLGGRVGAILSDGLLQLMGGGAYLLPIGLALLGWRGLFHRIREIGRGRIIGYALLLLFTPTLLDLWFWALPSPAGWILKGHPGGMMGGLLDSILMTYFNRVGTHIVIIAGVISSLMLFGSFSPMTLTAVTLKGLRQVVEGLATTYTIYRERSRRWKGLLRLQGRTTIQRRIPPARPKIVETPAQSTSVEQIHPPPPKQESFEFMKPSGDYELPPLTLLSDPPENRVRSTEEELLANSRILEKKLLDFDVEGRVVQVHPGPVVTMYEFEPAAGVKVHQIVNLSDDLALAMRAMSVRIVAPLPGKSAVGIEIPNHHREDVYLKELLASEVFTARHKLPLALGKDIFGAPVAADLATMPHLLVAGATGSGKSVALNAMILSLLFSTSPRDVKFIMIDPKLLELSAYEGIPHLMAPVLVRSKDAPLVFSRLVTEMQNRYRMLAEAGVRNIEGYNKKIQESPSANPNPPLPYLVVIVDELADLMVVAAREVEDSIARLAQMARAAGIHLVVATQRPSVDVLTGIIKANFPARISFQVSSKTDSRTILDANGAEQLLGRGDMLFLSPGTGRITRIHGAYVSEPEIRRVVDFVKAQSRPHYVDLLPAKGEAGPEEETGELGERDELYERAVDLVVTSGSASASLIQRRLRVGYPRAARMIEMMEEDGIVGPASGGKPREILARREEMESSE